MRTVFFYYNPIQKDTYWADEGTIFFDDQGWWIRMGGARVPISPGELVAEKAGFLDFDVPALIDELRAWGPIWSRWCGRGDEQELRLRTALLLILTLASGLRQLNVDLCVMHTGVSHHIDSVVFQMACRLAGVKTVFLYSEVLSTRLIPLVQQGGIESRRPLNQKISDFTYGAVIRDFLETKCRDLPPKNNVTVGGLAASWQWAIPYLLAKEFTRLLKMLRRWLFGGGPRSTLFGFAADTYPFQFVAQALKQRAALAYLRKHERSADCFLSDAKEDGAAPKLILAAHFQPEATSFPEGGAWGNHVDIALEVIRKGYDGPLLYKEHPATSMYLEGRSPTRVGMARTQEYYKHLEQIGCVFVDRGYKLSIDPKKNHWYVPITITGSIAIERALAGFHTIVTGHPWFRDMPGVLPLSDLESLADVKVEWSRPDPILARRAFEYLETFLNEKTLSNAPGIGTGKPQAGCPERQQFAREFGTMLETVRRTA